MLTIIAGSRSAREYHVIKALEECPWIEKITSVISGTAHGADRWGEKYAKNKGIEVIKFPAEWDMYGMSAGPRRNKEMAQNADSLIAIYDGFSRGTGSMLGYAKDFGLKTLIYFFNEERFESRDYTKKSIQYSLI